MSSTWCFSWSSGTGTVGNLLTLLDVGSDDVSNFIDGIALMSNFVPVTSLSSVKKNMHVITPLLFNLKEKSQKGRENNAC